MTDTAMFDLDSLYRLGDPSTSRDAARSQASKLSAMHQAVLDIYEAYPEGLTSSELSVIYMSGRERMGWPKSLPYTCIKRKSDLARMGRLVDTGVRRLNEHNSPESVWVLA